MGFDTPDAKYWRLKKLGVEVAVPERVKQARLLLQEATKVAQAANGAATSIAGQTPTPEPTSGQEWPANGTDVPTVQEIS